MKDELTKMIDYYEELFAIEKMDIDKSKSDKLKITAHSKMNLWTYFDVHRLVGKSIRYQHNYYYQIHNMPTHFMSLKELQKSMPVILKENFSSYINEKDKNDYLTDLKTAIDRVYQRSCLNGMNNTHMYPEEIISYIEGLMRMNPNDAWDSIERSSASLFALKLDKEIPKKDGIQEKRNKI